MILGPSISSVAMMTTSFVPCILEEALLRINTTEVLDKLMILYLISVGLLIFWLA